MFDLQDSAQQVGLLGAGRIAMLRRLMDDLTVPSSCTKTPTHENYCKPISVLNQFCYKESKAVASSDLPSPAKDSKIADGDRLRLISQSALRFL